MMFKNLQIYRLPQPWPIKMEELEERLATLRFSHCGSQQPISMGWISPVGPTACFACNRSKHSKTLEQWQGGRHV